MNRLILSRPTLSLLLILLAWPLALPGPAAAAVDILRMNVLVDIASEDQLTVTEELVVDVLGANANRGIYRDIPINSRWKDLARRKVDLKVLAVMIDGKHYPTDDINNEYPFVRIYLRDKSAYLSPGKHNFVLKYTITQQLGFFADHDELTWNVTGSGWATGVGSSLCMVLPPEGTSFTDYRAWLGLAGSKDTSVRFGAMEIKGREALIFKTKRPVKPGEHFTVAVSWPKGFSTAAPSLKPAEATTFTWLLLALLAGVSLTSALLWFFLGRDFNPGPAIARFYPPELPPRLRRHKGRQNERLSAAAVNYLWNKANLTSAGLAGLCISLIERGDCTVQGDSQSGFTIKGLQVSSQIAEERAVAKKLAGKTIELKGSDKEAGERLSAMHSACQDELKIEYRGQWQDNFLPICLSFLPALLGLPLLLRWHLGPFDRWPAELGDYAVAGFFMALALVIFAKCGWNLIRRARIWKSLVGLVGAIALTAFLAWIMSSNLADASGNIWSGLLWIFSPLQLALMAAIVFAPCLFIPIMDVPSHEAAVLRQEIAGLALYIGAAEADRLNMFNPPDRPLQLYQRLLPYAVALGLEKAWGASFARDLAEASQAASEDMADPTVRFLSDSRNLRGFSRSITNNMSSYTLSLNASGSSGSSGGSSFSFGGGGAGSGGGGGGGGGC